MAWRAIIEADLLGAINEAENLGYRSNFATTDAEDPLPAIVSSVTLEVREAIRSCGRNRLAPDPATIPEGAISHAIALIRHRLLTRFDVGDISEARLMEYREAKSYLRDVAACRRAVEQPDATEDTRPPIPSPHVNQSPRRDGWRDQDGI
jgi:hypothetical protein